MTTTRICWSLRDGSKAACSAASISLVSRFNCCGRFMVSVQTPVAVFAQQDRLVWSWTAIMALMYRWPRRTCAFSRSTNFWILPVEVLGSSPNTTARGALNLAIWLAAVLDDLDSR